MTEQIKKWFLNFAQSGLISSREAFAGYVCDACGEDITKPENDCFWTGQNFGMGDYTICPQCYDTNQYQNTNRCDFRFWKMFQLPTEEIEKIQTNWVTTPSTADTEPMESTPILKDNHNETPEEFEKEEEVSDLPAIIYTREQQLARAISEAKDKYNETEGQRCTKFDLGAGWYRRRGHDEDLCQYHGGLIMSSNDPDQQKWKERFRLVTSADLSRIELSDLKQYVHYEDGRGGVFLCHPCDLVLPEQISPEQYLKVNRQWFEISPENDATDRQLCPIWLESCVAYNGNQSSALYDKFVVMDTQIGNIAQWVPFDSSENPVGLEGSDGGFALVNCNPQSGQYLQVATMISDNHGRTSFDLARMTLSDYLEQKAKYLTSLPLPDEAVHEIYSCDTCDAEAIKGRRYKCCHREDLCHECYTKGKRCQYTKVDGDHLVEEQAFHPLDFIEHLRQKLEQGFYYG